MNQDQLKFVIVGHVDHGKSTLIGRLLYDTGSLPEGKIEEIKKICDSLGKELELGYVMDHLEEERDQGITIDTAQIFFKTPKRDYVIIDAPGHVEFVKNMITGSSQADAALLIVDAEEGIKEQTQRHAYILSMLGIDQVIVLINKMDLVGYRESAFNDLSAQLRQFLQEIAITPLAIIPVSAKQGDLITKASANMAWYSGPALLESLDSLAMGGDADNQPLRFIVQDVYCFDKRIVVGKVESGVLRQGDRIRVLPTGEQTAVKSIEEFLKTPTIAHAGKSIGFTTADKLFIDRGHVVCHDTGLPTVTDLLTANIFWMDRTPLQRGASLTFRCGTQEVPCIVSDIAKVIDSSTLESLGKNMTEVKNREVAEVTIRTDKPVVVDCFRNAKALGRFVLGKAETQAGGIITGTSGISL